MTQCWSVRKVTMKAQVLRGSKQQIADKVAKIDGDVKEAIVFVDEPSASSASTVDTFADMDPFTVHQPTVDDSREAIYRPMEGE
jgi:hypothetical protein